LKKKGAAKAGAVPGLSQGKGKRMDVPRRTRSGRLCETGNGAKWAIAGYLLQGAVKTKTSGVAKCKRGHHKGNPLRRTGRKGSKDLERSVLNHRESKKLEK